MPQDIFHLTSAGSVDDGKSTILARLLLDTGSVFEDQLGGIDPATVTATTIADLLDGLESEREQGITIDVAHRFFDSATRRYHIADSPGHEQYTKNMATAASHANGLLLVIDARVGPKPQTLTHLRIAHQLGIRHVIVAINKMDLVDRPKQVFSHRLTEVTDMMSNYPGISPVIIPVSGLTGANIVHRGKAWSWWEGPTILQALDALPIPTPPLRDNVFAVQHVHRQPGGGRLYMGSLISGTISVGDTLSHPTSTQQVTITALFSPAGETTPVHSPAEITLGVEKDIHLSRGDILTTSDQFDVTDQVECDLVWLADIPGVVGRVYECRLGHNTLRATLTRAWNTTKETAAKTGETKQVTANQVATVHLHLSEKIAITPFTVLPELGRGVLVDPATGDTIAALTITHSLRRGENITPHDFAISTTQRSELTGHTGKVLWFTGLSGSGKSTIADALSQRLHAEGIAHTVLDGDNLRQGLNRDLGFTEADRVENIRRTAEVAALMADAGLIVLVSLISPYEKDRQGAKDIIGEHRFAEIFVDTPLEVCEQRDPKGLYKKARAGEIPNFTGIGAPYEAPQNPAVVITPTHEGNEVATQLLRLATRHQSRT
jgi:bifunctional enzyme CysN/CysC